MKIDTMTVDLIVKVKCELSLWSALKLRLAGKKYYDTVSITLKQTKTELANNPKVEVGE